VPKNFSGSQKGFLLAALLKFGPLFLLPVFIAFYIFNGDLSNAYESLSLWFKAVLPVTLLRFLAAGTVRCIFFQFFQLGALNSR